MRILPLHAATSAAVCAIAIYFRDTAAIIPIAVGLTLLLPKTRHVSTALALSCCGLALFYSLSALKKHFVGQPIFGFDVLIFIREIVILAANDWRVLCAVAVCTVCAVLVVVAYVQLRFRSMSAFRIVALFGVWSSVALVSIMATAGQAEVDEINLADPTVWTFVRSATISYRLTPTPVVDENAGDNVAAEPAPRRRDDLPHIVVILQESTVAPSQAGPGFVYEPRHLFADSDSSHTGLLDVATFGGGTALNEFAFMAQIRPARFGRFRSYVLFVLEHDIRRSIFTTLSEIGYRSTVFYVAPGYYMNAGPFYLAAGADAFVDPEAAGIGTGWNWSEPDDTFYGLILDHLAMPDPQFVKMLTIAQHGPHDVSNPIGDYERRFRVSDEAKGKFLADVASTASRPVVILTYGDHRPLFMEDTVASDQLKVTNFQVECHPTTACDLSNVPDRVDISALASVLFDVAGLPRNSLMLAQDRILGDCIYNGAECEPGALARYNWHFERIALDRR